jgi:hypothetical protein
MAKDADLDFIASQNERILAEVAAMRHDIAVLMATAMRLEAAQATTLQELHTTRAQARNGRTD